MAALPSSVRLLLNGYADSADYGVLRTEMDGGIAKQRPRRSLPVVTREATLMVHSLGDRLSFDAWARDEIQGGTGWFDFQTLDGTVRPARFVGGDIRWSSRGAGVWLAQVQIETLG